MALELSIIVLFILGIALIVRMNARGEHWLRRAAVILVLGMTAIAGTESLQSWNMGMWPYVGLIASLILMFGIFALSHGPDEYPVRYHPQSPIKH